MLNYDEFPYQEYFFDSISNIQSLYEEIQKNTNLEDEEISNILFLTKSGITKKRNRALEKIRREFEKRRHF